MKKVLFVALITVASFAHAVTEADVIASEQRLNSEIKKLDRITSFNAGMAITNNILAPAGDALARAIYNEDDTIDRIQRSGSFRVMSCKLKSIVSPPPTTWVIGNGVAVVIGANGTMHKLKEVAPHRYASKPNDTFIVDADNVKVDGETFFGERYVRCQLMADQNWQAVAYQQQPSSDQVYNQLVEAFQNTK